ncbi:MAG: hypothetical protein ACI8T1_002875 [Verrucomicrobiales bacterium]|jgi:hypothetical protein
MKLPSLLLSAVLTLLFVSCASNETIRQRRVDANADSYNSLSDSDRELVDQGKIREGMAKQAVFISWGRPNDIRKGSNSGVPYETWIYTDNRAHTQASLSLGYGFGMDPYYPYYGGRYYGRSHLGFHPSAATTYRPIKVGKVEFLNDKVVSWEASSR